MNKQEKLETLMICHSVQQHRYEDLSGINSIRKATKREIIRAYKRIGKPPPPDIVEPMKIVRKVANG